MTILDNSVHIITDRLHLHETRYFPGNVAETLVGQQRMPNCWALAAYSPWQATQRRGRQQGNVWCEHDSRAACFIIQSDTFKLRNTKEFLKVTFMAAKEQVCVHNNEHYNRCWVLYRAIDEGRAHLNVMSRNV